MDIFFGPNGVLNSNPFFDIRIPYYGSIPPPGYTLVHDSIVYIHNNATPVFYPPIYNYYFP
jgi:hypothetical protein